MTLNELESLNRDILSCWRPWHRKNVGLGIVAPLGIWETEANEMHNEINHACRYAVRLDWYLLTVDKALMRHEKY